MNPKEAPIPAPSRLGLQAGPGAPLTEVRVCPDAPALMRAAAAEFLRAADDCVSERGSFSVALSGGSTPRALYSLLASEEIGAQRKIPWVAMHFFFSDERAVLPDRPDSNFRMAYESLLSRVPAPRQNIHRVPSELPVRAAAEVYEEQIVRFFGTAPGARPSFDLVLLGLGADGHTASLFPGAATLEDTEQLVLATRPAHLQSERITFTLPLINAAARVMFVVSGEDKAAAVQRVLRGGRDGELLPAQRVRPASGRLLWLLDEPAARLLCDDNQAGPSESAPRAPTFPDPIEKP